MFYDSNQGIIENIFFFIIVYLPFIAIIVGFIANFFKHPIDMAFNYACCTLCVFAFIVEAFMEFANIMGGCESASTPTANIAVFIIAIMSMSISAEKDQKRRL
jgi:hypothetical protein